MITDKNKWFNDELLKLKKEHPFISWYYPKWLSITEWFYGKVYK